MDRGGVGEKNKKTKLKNNLSRLFESNKWSRLKINFASASFPSLFHPNGSVATTATEKAESLASLSSVTH